MILIDGAEDSVDVLVRDGHLDVVLAEEVTEELAELLPIQELVTIVIVLLEVLHHLFHKGTLVGLELLQLVERLVELALSKISTIDLHLLRFVL